MTRGILPRAAAGLLAIALVAPASGLDRRQRSVYITAGYEARIASYGALDESCNVGAPPEIEVVERPSYGTLGNKPVRIIADRSNMPRRDHPCIGKFIVAIAVYYRPTPGFHGSDRIRLRIKFDAATPAHAATMLEDEIFIGVR